MAALVPIQVGPEERERMGIKLLGSVCEVSRGGSPALLPGDHMSLPLGLLGLEGRNRCSIEI